MEGASPGFPATLEIDYPDRELDRLTTFFRLFTVIPIAIILALVTRATVRADSANYVVGSGGTGHPAFVPRRRTRATARLAPGRVLLA